MLMEFQGPRLPGRVLHPGEDKPKPRAGEIVSGSGAAPMSALSAPERRNMARRRPRRGVITDEARNQRAIWN